MKSFKEYASEKGVSYEAIRVQVQRYSKELKGHIKKQNRTQYLDDYAVEFLDSKRRENPVIVYEKGRTDELEELRETVESLKSKLLEAQQTIIDLKEKEVRLIEDSTKYSLLLEDKGRMEGELSELKEDLKKKDRELQSYQRTFFGLYKKIEPPQASQNDPEGA